MLKRLLMFAISLTLSLVVSLLVTYVALLRPLRRSWGLDPDEAFEDNPELMGVDYDGMTKVRACGNKMSTELKHALLEVPKGYILEVKKPVVQPKPTITTPVQLSSLKPFGNTGYFPPQEALKQLEEMVEIPAKTLLIIGDGQDVTIDEQTARAIALKVEHGFEVMAGTPDGNPGYMLELISQYTENRGITLVQPAYMQGRAKTNGFRVIYEGDTKDAFRDCLVSKADVVLAIGGNDGTWSEIQRAVAAGKPTVVIKDSGSAWANAAGMQDETLYLFESFEKAIEKIAGYRNS